MKFSKHDNARKLKQTFFFLGTNLGITTFLILINIFLKNVYNLKFIFHVQGLQGLSSGVVKNG